MADIETLMTILEGHCPDDGAELKITSIGGYPHWLYEDVFDPRASAMTKCPYDLTGVEISKWNRPSFEMGYTEREIHESYRDMNVGSVVFECPICHKTYYVEQTPYGDWVGDD